ncbi:MAG: CHAT domain-containing protein [Sulfuritalea sp.]|nr:CHAT domain-containing protein [Sulfuritalea sp.]
MNVPRPFALRNVLLRCGLLLATAFMCVGGAAADEEHSRVPPRTIFDVTALLEQFKPDPIKVESAKARLAQQPPEGADNSTLARFYFERARAAEELGDVKKRREDFRKAREYVSGTVDTWWVLDGMSSAEQAVGNLRNAVELRQQAAKAAGGPSRAIHNYARLVGDYLGLGDFAAAKEQLALLERTYASVTSGNASGWFKDTYLSRVEEGRAYISFATGKYALAEAQFRKSMKALEDYIELTPRIPASAGRTGSIAGQKLRLEGLLIWLSRSQIAQGRRFDAELTLREALKSALSERGPDDALAQAIVSAMASLLNDSGRFKESEVVLNNSMRILGKIGISREAATYLLARSRLTDALVGQGRWKEALANYQASLAALSGDPVLGKRFQMNSVSAILAMLHTGQFDEADVLLKEKANESLLWLGADHRNTAEFLALQAVARAKQGKLDEALALFRKTVPVLVSAASEQADASALRSQRLALVFETYLSVLGRVRGTVIEQQAGISAADEGFLLADGVRNQSTQQAVVASAIRAAASDPVIGGDIRRLQDLDQEQASLHKILRDLMNVSADQLLPKVIADMKARIAAIGEDKRVQRSSIEKRFPAYSNLVNPSAPSIAEARESLRSGEALMNIFSTGTETYVWAFKKEGPVAFAVVPLNREQVGSMVARLRNALDPGDVDIEHALPRYDLDTGFELYSKLLTPVAVGWQGATSLLVAANGALGQLPLAVLPTAKSALAGRLGMPYTEYSDVAWLIRQMAVTQLPSVNALVVLRKLPAGRAERTPFIGFGDPLFGKEQIASTGSRRLRNLSIARTEPVTAAPAPDVKPVATTTPDWVNYSKIPPLPDTREEILSLAATLKADTTKDVFLGAEASKANVKKLDLSKRRIVAFATHGLLPNDFPGVAEPSLALANPQDGHHGLLTMEDILGLKLDADWVVLSACNTAAGDGTAADAVSGLGRGFFYAGTRALLVTHWPVESVSARLLVTGLFERQAKDATLSRAQALRQSMLSLMQQNSGSFAYAHPLFWAPYALVGDGGG